MANLIITGILIHSAFIGTIAWIIRRQCFQYANFSYVKENEVLQGSIIVTLPGKSTAECEAECVREYRCKSINIQIAGERHCQLNSENVLDKMANLTLTSKAGWTHKATSYNETLLGVNCKYFKPCAVNDVCVDSCDCPGYICYRCRGINIGINCLANIVVEGTALGMENGKIQNYQITASSYNTNEQKPFSARLNAAHGWCAHSAKVNQNQFLKVDLIRRKIITDVAVQGFKNGDWVTKYRLEYTGDNIAWQFYEEDGSNKTFDGTTSINAIVKQNLVYYIKAYSIKINPRVWVKWICMRIELYGIDDPWQPLIPKVIVGLPLGLEDFRIQDYQMSASSYTQNGESPPKARLNRGTRWCTSGTTNEFIRVDFVSRKILTDIAIQGHGGSTAWVSAYKLLYTEDSYEWKTYQVNGNKKIFTGPISGYTMNKQTLPYWIRVFAIKIYPTSWYQTICIRMELYGIEDPEQPPIPAGCSNNVRPLGMASKAIPDASITASGYYNNGFKPKFGRLNEINGWCEAPGVGPPSSFIQVDIGKKMNIVAVATQGAYYQSDYREWVTSYYVSYSNTGSAWTWVMVAGNKKVFTGNTDRSGIVKNKFEPSIKARHVRITPKTHHQWICIRMELYGCDLV